MVEKSVTRTVAAKRTGMTRQSASPYFRLYRNWKARQLGGSKRSEWAKIKGAKEAGDVIVKKHLVNKLNNVNEA
ncbi:hypothetical protein PtB15_14B440 [Puccinia triticina]|nr:hypothetical protein PtB15_14B440 [Puccinia triticina]